MLEETKTQLIRNLFSETNVHRNAITRKRFLAKHHDQVREIQALIAEGALQLRDGQHILLPLAGLADLARSLPEAESVRYLCAHLFDVVRSAFTENPDVTLSVSEIAELAEMPESKVARAFGYLLDAAIWERWTQDSEGLHTDIVISERILDYDSLDDVIVAIRLNQDSGRQETRVYQQNSQIPNSVDPQVESKWREPTEKSPRTASYTPQAEHAVIEAIKSLVASGQRAHVGECPDQGRRDAAEERLMTSARERTHQT